MAPERALICGTQGTVTAPDRVTLENALEQLRAAVSFNDTTLVVYELTTPKQATVRRSGKPLFAYVTDRIATYSVMVTAGDPRRYSTSLQSQTTGLPITSGGLTFPITVPITFSATGGPGQVTATNAGDLETRPVLTLAGPVVAPLISALYPDGSVCQLIYSQNLQTGDVLIVDTDAHTVLINGGVSRRRFMTVSGAWPTIPAGQSVDYLFQSTTYSATATLTVQWRSAWM